jgi:hypothetical protein
MAEWTTTMSIGSVGEGQRGMVPVPEGWAV